MERKQFNKLMKRNISEIKDFYSIICARSNIIKRMINFCYNKDPHNPRGHINLIVAMEELAELQQEISKGIRGKLDRNGLLEEIVDVEHALMVLKEVYKINDAELNKARYIKASRIQRKIENNNFK